MNEKLRKGQVCLLAALAAAAMALAQAAPAGAVETTLVDLGTLGGRGSYGTDINEQGQAIGNSGTIIAGRQAFVWSAAGGMTALESLGGANSDAKAINSFGEAAGYSITTAGEAHAVYWSASGVATDLGTLGGDSSNASGINENGQVFGTSRNAADERRAFFWDPATGVMTDLGSLGGGRVMPADMNDAGQIVGYAIKPGGNWSAFLWDPAGGLTELSTLGGDYSDANAINNAGQVVGAAEDVHGHIHAVLWQGNAHTVLTADLTESCAGALINSAGEVIIRCGSGGSQHYAYYSVTTGRVPIEELGGGDFADLKISIDDFNDAGVAVGRSRVVSTGVDDWHAIRWTLADRTEDLGTFGGYDDFYARAINEAGVIAGEADEYGTLHGFVYDAGAFTELPGLGGAETLVRDINDGGQVVGTSDTPADVIQPFLWNETAGMTNIGPDSGLSRAWRINGLGQVLGPEGLWTPGGGLAAVTFGTKSISPSDGFSLNDAGQIAGWFRSDDCTGNIIDNVCYDHALRWSESAGGTDLGNGPYSHNESQGYAINAAGDVAGASWHYEGGSICGYAEDHSAHVWLAGGARRDLGLLPAPGGTLPDPEAAAEATAINNAGQAIGTVWVQEWVDAGYLCSGEVPSRSQTRGFIWSEATGLEDLGTLGGATFPIALNDLGQVVGSSVEPGGHHHAFLWEDGLMTDLGTLGGDYSQALDISESGLVVGIGDTPSGDVHAFLWTEGQGMVDLGALGESSEPVAINELGQVVGRSRVSGLIEHAVIWQISGDFPPPALSVPADITAEATGPDGAVVTYSATADDPEDGVITPDCVPASGSVFPLGTTVVTCTAADLAGNTASAAFNVTVEDTTPPVLSLPLSVVAEATGPGGAVVTYSATAQDAVDGPIAVACSPGSGSLFPLGATVVTCTARRWTVPATPRARASRSPWRTPRRRC